jgi:predicted aspartyl protease
LYHLKAALTGDAGQVLWDSDASATNTLEKLTKLLRSRFSATQQADKHRMELRLRRRRQGESLSALHQDIRRLMALAHPTLSQEARETIACDYYIDAMDDVDFALKVRERAPATLDEALRIALQLEAWQRDARRSRSDDGNQTRTKARGAAQSSTSESHYEAQFELLNRRIDELTRMMKAPAAETSPMIYAPVYSQPSKEGAVSPTNSGSQGAVELQPNKQQGASTASRPSGPRRQYEARRPVGVCWTCGQPGHMKRNCEQVTPKTSPGAVSRGSRGLDHALVYLRMELGGRSLACLLDSGCEVTLIPKALVEASKDIELLPSKQRIWAANGTEIGVAGEAVVPLLLDGRCVDTFAVVSPDIEEVTLGADWLQAHKCLWDFGSGKLYIDGRTAVPLHRKRALCCRRVYLQEEGQAFMDCSMLDAADNPLVPTEGTADSQAASNINDLADRLERVSKQRMKHHRKHQAVSTLSTLTSVFVPSQARAAAISDARMAANKHIDGEVASVLAGEHLQAAQHQDPDIGPVLRFCLQHTASPDIKDMLPYSEATKVLWSQRQQLELHSGVLYRRHLIKGGRAEVLQLLIPAALRDDCMKQAHGEKCGGHLGLRRTLEKVRRRAYWVGWRRDVKRFCRQCPNCNSYDRRMKPQHYSAGDWVQYFSPEKFGGRQDKWYRKFNGPYLVVKVLGPVNLLLQRSKRSKPFAVHIDKVKPYQAADMPKSWLTNSSSEAVTAEAEDPASESTDSCGGASAEHNASEATVNEVSNTSPTPIANVSPASDRSTRPRRHDGRPRRYND